MRRTVVLPEPDGPSREKNSPESIVRSTPSTATTSSKRLTIPLSSTVPAPTPASDTCSPSPGPDRRRLVPRPATGHRRSGLVATYSVTPSADGGYLIGGEPVEPPAEFDAGLDVELWRRRVRGPL